MSDEATVRVGLEINADNVRYRLPKNAFKVDVIGRFGPSPGSIRAVPEGTEVNLGELGTPGLVVFDNQGDELVTIGVFHADVSILLPLFEVLPGEAYVYRFSRYFGYQFLDGSLLGTGSADGSPINVLKLFSETIEVPVFVGAFEA